MHYSHIDGVNLRNNIQEIFFEQRPNELARYQSHQPKNPKSAKSKNLKIL